MNVTNSEWYVLKCLWNKSPQTLTELTAQLHDEINWSKSTCATMVRRMTEKKLIDFTLSGKTKHFYPLVDKDVIVKQETKDFLKRIYDGSVGMLISGLVQADDLSEEEIRELQDILKKAQQ
ncbi:MAG: BlaI/MecI/CopY family transcriptional regulator [Lachnospiraceae bacterium]|nr:BlaI/MecI/CopY family transcriptional regulator [Lachnospiraceae bacterium]